MPNACRRIFQIAVCAKMLGMLLASAPSLGQSASGRLEGEVLDAMGYALPNAVIELQQESTGISLATTTNKQGEYAFPSLPVGSYRIEMHAQGFAPWSKNGVRIAVSQTVRMDEQLTPGSRQEAVEVHADSLTLDTAGAGMGQSLERETVDAMPLNGRSFTDLLALQPGVTPQTTMTSDTVQGLGQSVFSPSGGLNAGVLSINGQRESANAYVVNGANAEETGSMAAAVIPNLDSIDEFHILVNNFDAEYGRFSGGQINVVTRSGGNAWHGDGFEFLRNTDFDARNYFSSERAKYQQNQYGGVLGGPIRKSRAFFFADFQQTKQLQGADTGLIAVPTDANRNGNFSASPELLSGSVSGSYQAAALSQKLGRTIHSGDAYYTSTCKSDGKCVFPDATIDSSLWSKPAKTLLNYIPKANTATNEFSTSQYNMKLQDTKEALKLDGKSRFGHLSAYAAIDNYTLDDPYPTTQGGANVPGFNALSEGGSKMAVLEGDAMLHNGFFEQTHLSYTRVVNNMGVPAGGVGVSLAEQGFVTGASTLGIVAGNTAHEGIASVAFGNFTIGTDPNQYEQINNIYEWSSDIAKIAGRHSIRAGIHADHDEINTYPLAQLNGSFQFYGSETGSDFADFLLGVASQYNQNGLRPFYERENYWGAYIEDSWRTGHALTWNYGLRWDRISPWWEKYNNAMTLVKGQQSTVFPTAPTGIVYPGDTGIPRTLAPIGNTNMGPRVGIAWALNGNQQRLLSRVFGNANESILRAGFGIYYTAIPGETLGLISDNAPYGFTYTSPAPPLFAEPFRDAATGNSEGQRFPAKLAPLTVSRKNPDSDVDWSRFEPISAVPGMNPRNSTGYAEEYSLSLERSIHGNTILSIGYAGNQGHKLLVLKAANAGDQALCLSLSTASAVSADSPTCGPFGESTLYTTAAGTSINGTRKALGPAFGSVSTQDAIGNSHYDSLQTSVKSRQSWGEWMLGYTWSNSLDDASNFGDQVNPLNPGLSRALSSFNLRHNLVGSFTIHGQIPGAVMPYPRLRSGWQMSGILRVVSGFPVTLTNFSDTSLWGTQSNGVNNLPVDEPDFTSGALRLNHNPRNGKSYFEKSLFKLPAAGDPGNARRRFFDGPGMANLDMSMEKQTRMHAATSLTLRVEAFNLLNHAEFFGPQSVNGNVTNADQFGQVVSAASPRLMQLAARLNF